MSSPNTIATQSRHLAIALFILLAASIFSTSILGSTPFFTRGEAREALVVKAMNSTQNYILPRTDGDQISAKPPMLHWLAISTARIVGYTNEGTIRFPSAMTGGLALAFLFLVILSVYGTSSAVISILILASSLEWLRAGTHARVDMCLAFGITLASCSLYKISVASHSTLKQISLWCLLAVGGISIAVLSKGPMGLLIPLAVIGIYWISESGILGWLKGQPLVVTGGIFVIAALLSGVWYHLAYTQLPEEFYRVHVVNENVARFIEVPDYKPGHVKPFYYGFIYLFTGFMPWTVFFPILISWLSRNRFFLFSENTFTRFCVLWAAVIIVMCFVASAKRSVYFLPAFPPLAFLTVGALNAMISDVKKYARSYGSSKSLLYLVSGLVILATVLLFVFTFMDSVSDPLLQKYIRRPKDLEETILIQNIFKDSPIFFLFLPVVSLGFLASSILFKKLDVYRSIVCIAFSIMLGTLLAGRFVIDDYARETEPSGFISKLETYVKPSDSIFQFKDTYFAVCYYAHHKIPRIDTVKPANESPYYMLVNEKNLKSFIEMAPEAELMFQGDNFSGNRRGWLRLYKISK